MSNSPLLEQIGTLVRELREKRGLNRGQLADSSGLSLRFLAELERGGGNISILRLRDLAHALETTAGELLSDAEARLRVAGRGPLVALLGVRGAGKSTIGRALAARLGVPLIELDARVEQTAGLTLGQIFELHGEAYYRRLEAETLGRIVREHTAAVVATGGSIVTAPGTYRLLRRHFLTVWLRATAEDHWARVVAQGDGRPMDRNPHAMTELRALLAAREPLYKQAHQVLDTTKLGVEGAVELLVRELGAPG
jgi:XRE family aerobic/anaerobic benzoate catabolism transcriptional regulator